MKIVIIVLASLLMVSIAGISVAVSTSGSSGSDRTFDQITADLENSSVMMNLMYGRLAGKVEILGQIAEANYYGNETEIDDATFAETIIQYNKAIIDYNKILKEICNESRYDELKIKNFKLPSASPVGPGALVNEYGDYIGPGASYDGDQLLYNDTMVTYLVYGRKAGNAEVVGQIAEANHYGNETEKIDYATFDGAITQCNIVIRDYNKILKAHCDESRYRYDEFKIEEFRI